MRSFIEMGGEILPADELAEFYADMDRDSRERYDYEMEAMAAYHTKLQNDTIAKSRADAAATGGVSLFDYTEAQINALADSFAGETVYF